LKKNQKNEISDTKRPNKKLDYSRPGSKIGSKYLATSNSIQQQNMGNTKVEGNTKIEGNTKVEANVNVIPKANENKQK